MKNKVKYIVLFIAIILLIGLVIFIINKNNGYSLENIHNLITNQKEKSNYAIHSETKYLTGEKLDIYYDEYHKDNYSYRVGTMSNETEVTKYEIYTDYNTNERINVDDNTKAIIYFKLDNIGTSYTGDQETVLKASKENYSYLGKEEVNGKEIVKFKVQEGSSEIIMYLEPETGNIIKSEYYYVVEGNLEKVEETTYEYTYNNVNEIKTFDIENYPEYKYIENE